MAQVLHVGLPEFALLALDIELMVPKLLKNPSQMPLMLLLSLREHQDVIEVDQDKLVKGLVKHGVHQALEGAGGVTQAQGQYCKFKQSKPRHKGGFELVALFHRYLIVAGVQVNATQNTCPTQPIQQVINPGQGIPIQLGLFVQGTIVYAHTQ